MKPTKKIDEVDEEFIKHIKFHDPRAGIEPFTISQDELRAELINRLKNRWVILLGLVEDIEPIENYAFKPGTGEEKSV